MTTYLFNIKKYLKNNNHYYDNIQLLYNLYSQYSKADDQSNEQYEEDAIIADKYNKILMQNDDI